MRRGGSAGRHRGRCTPVASGAVPGGSVQEKCEPGTPVSTQDSDTSSAGGTPGGERVHQASPGYGGVPEVPGARTYVPAPAPISSQFPPARLPPVPPLPPRPELPARSAVPGSVGCQAPRLPAGVRGSAAPGCAALRRAPLGCAPSLCAPRLRPLLAWLRPARLRPAVPGALAGGPRGGVGAGRAGGRAGAGGCAAPGRPAAAWKLLIWAVMSGEVAGAGPPTSFHSHPRVSCRPARGPRARTPRAPLLWLGLSPPASPPATLGSRRWEVTRGRGAAGGSREGSASGESPLWPGSWEVLRGGLLQDGPCHSGRRPALRARPGSRAVISSPALGEGCQGSPGGRRRGPASGGPAWAAPCPAAIHPRSQSARS